MRHDQPTSPFDVEADDMTQQFWGASKSWVSSEQPTVRRRAERIPAPARRSDDTGSLRVIRDGFAAFRPQTTATGEITRQRQHGAPRRHVADDVPEATLGELAAGRADFWLDDELPQVVATDPRGRDHARVAPENDVPLTPALPLVERLGLGAVDPLLLRAGVFVLVALLLVPVMLSLRPDRDDSLPGDMVEAPQSVVAGAAPAPTDTPVAAPAAPTATSAAVPSTASPAAAPTEAVATSPSAPAPAPDTATADTATADTAQAISDTSTETASTAITAPAASDESRIGDDAAEVDVVAERIVPACPQKYTAAPGDSWYRIADGAGVTPSRLLAENNATTDTVILPGDDICLPEGATMPTPPVAPATTAPEADEPAPTTPATTTTVTPSTTSPTTTAAPVANLSREQVQDLIRQTWPADQVDKALAVARRESNFIATADNGWCCVGVFQIYWTVHQGWLDDFGITKRSDLFDARKNIAAAFDMWQSQGWGPWGG